MSSFALICLVAIFVCNLATFEAQRKRIDYLEDRIEMMERSRNE